MQGQHTTTFAEMYDLSFSSRIIDTPESKFGIVDMKKEEIGDYFPEFFQVKNGVNSTVQHLIKNLKCAVKEALDKDQIAFSRYKSYLQLLEGDDEHYRTDNWTKE